jgi:ankyrin repeat protein
MADNLDYKHKQTKVDKIKDLFDSIDSKNADEVKTILEENEISAKSLGIAFTRAFTNYKECEKTRDIVNSLLSYKADADLVLHKNQGTTGLLLAAQENDVLMARILLNYGAKVNSKDVLNKNSLIYLIQSGKQDIDEFVLVLINNGININNTDNEGNCPLTLAASKGYYNVVRMLLESGADADAVNTYTGNTALHYTVIGNRMDIAGLILSKRPKLSIQNKQGFSAVDLALNLNRTEMYSYLAEEYNNIKADDSSSTPQLSISGKNKEGGTYIS